MCAHMCSLLQCTWFGVMFCSFFEAQRWNVTPQLVLTTSNSGWKYRIDCHLPTMTEICYAYVFDRIVDIEVDPWTDW